MDKQKAINETIKQNFLFKNKNFYKITTRPKTDQSVLVVLIDNENNIIEKVIDSSKFDTFNDLERVIGWKYIIH